MGREKVSGTVIRTRRPQTTVPDTFSALTPFPHLGGTLGAADGGNQFAYDSAGRVTSLTDLNGGVTQFAYDSQGNLLSLTDPVGNTTSWLHDSANQVTQQTDALGASRHFTYDSTGNLSRYADCSGQVRQYGLDSAGNLASETWYANTTDADASQNTLNAIQYTRDSAGRITSESDAVSSVAYVYDSAGRLTATTQSSVGGPTVTLAYQYDTAGHRTQMAATVDHPQAGTRADFVDDYAYDSLGRVVSVTEHGVTGGDVVADKTVDLTYNDAGQVLSIERYEGTELVVTADYTYDSSGRLAGLLYHQGTTVLNSYAWTYSGDSSSSSSSLIPNPQSLIPSPWLPTGGLMPVHDTAGVTDALASGGLAGLDLLTGVTSSDGTASYTYDATGQLIGATYSANSQSLIANPSESFSYDANGNRTNAGYLVGTGNRLLSDGIYTYCYDSEGDRTAKFIDANEDSLLDSGDTDVTQYAWDFRNRLVEVTHRAAAGGAATQVVDYLYDVEDRWIGENIDSDGDGQFDHATRFAYDGTQIVLQFDKDVSGVPGSADALTVADLTHRYLWEPGVVDQLLANERTQLGANGDVATDELLWALTDHLGTVRDVARSDGTATSVVNHIVYETFGTIVSQSDSTQGTLFGFTGRPLDTATGLQNNWHRVYDSITGGWLSTDPLSFTAGDANTSRYVGNSPTNATDPTGLVWIPTKEAWIWKATQDGDSLQDLAVLIDNLYPVAGENAESYYKDWVCIWPEKAREVPEPEEGIPASPFGFWHDWIRTGEPIAKAGALADVSNLLIGVSGDPALRKPTRISLAVSQSSADPFLRGLRTMMNSSDPKFFKNWDRKEPETAVNKIKEVCDRGRTPIGWMFIGAHGDGAGGLTDMTGENPLTVQQFIASSDNDTNDFVSASKKHGPPRSWFTRTARVWVGGCLTGVNITWGNPSDDTVAIDDPNVPNGIHITGLGGWAEEFATYVLRTGAEAYGTNVFLATTNKGVSAAYWTKDLRKKSKDPRTGLYPNLHDGYVMRSIVDLTDENLKLGEKDHWNRFQGGQ